MLVCPQPVKNMPPARAARPVHGPSVGSRTGVVLEWRCVGVDLVHLQFCMWWEAHSGPRRCLDLGGALGRERDRVRNTVRSLIPKNFERSAGFGPSVGPRAPRASSPRCLRIPDSAAPRRIVAAVGGPARRSARLRRDPVAGVSGEGGRRPVYTLPTTHTL